MQYQATVSKYGIINIEGHNYNTPNLNTRFRSMDIPIETPLVVSDEPMEQAHSLEYLGSSEDNYLSFEHSSEIYHAYGIRDKHVFLEFCEERLQQFFNPIPNTLYWRKL